MFYIVFNYSHLDAFWAKCQEPSKVKTLVHSTPDVRAGSEERTARQPVSGFAVGLRRLQLVASFWRVACLLQPTTAL